MKEEQVKAMTNERDRQHTTTAHRTLGDHVVQNRGKKTSRFHVGVERQSDSECCDRRPQLLLPGEDTLSYGLHPVHLSHCTIYLRL